MVLAGEREGADAFAPWFMVCRSIMASLSQVATAMNDVYANLIRLVDVHIERLVDLEDALDAELQATEASMVPVGSYHEPLLFGNDNGNDSEMTVDVDDEYGGPSESDLEESAIMSLSQIALPHVSFNNTVFQIDDDHGPLWPGSDTSLSSSGTVPLNYTPFPNRRIIHTDSDSDAESIDTQVDDWIDPASSPTYRDTIGGRSIFGDSYDSL
jgi:thiol-disulfide isomerase/thioredoxin